MQKTPVKQNSTLPKHRSKKIEYSPIQINPHTPFRFEIKNNP
jgi:hypothetical protein